MPRNCPGWTVGRSGLVNVQEVRGRSRAKVRRVVAIAQEPVRWMRVRARLRKAARTCGAWSVRRR
ncbi:MAG: hypothetical protein ACJ8BW_15140 [Ktedonobacteraceae bacterium]